jgi:hypothetical protein
VLNGMTLGLGVATRIGSWLLYAVQVTCLLTGWLLLGALMYGVYGLVRTGVGPLALVSVLSRIGSRVFVARLTASRRRLAAQGVLLTAVEVSFVFW